MGGLVKSIFGGGQQQQAAAVQPAPVAPAVADPAVQQASDDEIARQKKAAGRASTDLTGGAGLLDEAVTAKKTLLGA